MGREDGPWSECKASVTIDDRWFLTHVIWHPTMIWGGHDDLYETGVRFLDEPGVDGRPRFELIEHGWTDHQAAEDIIVHALRKGWDVPRIFHFMVRLKELKRAVLNMSVRRVPHGLNEGTTS